MQNVQVSSGDLIEVLQEPETYRRNETGEVEVVIPPHAPEPEAIQTLPQVKIELADDMQNAVDIKDAPVTIFRTKPKDAEDVMLKPLIFHHARKIFAVQTVSGLVCNYRIPPGAKIFQPNCRP